MGEHVSLCPYKRYLSARGLSTIETLRKRILALVPLPGVVQLGVPGLAVTVRTEENATGCGFYEPSIGFVISGSKTSVIGDEVFHYDAGAMILTGMDVPSAYCAMRASAADPFVAIHMRLDAAVLSELLVMLEPQLSEIDSRIADEDCLAFAVPKPDESVLFHLERLFNCAQDPIESKYMAPLISRELHMQLLLGPAGRMLREIFTKDTLSNRVGRAVSWLRENFEKPFDADELADMVHMAPSTFHRHFKAVTQMSPLQYQKRLRLTAAQRLMMTEGLDAATAAYRVGYRSPAQFSRDYGKLFNESPKRHVRRLKAGDGADAASAQAAEALEH